MRQALPGTRENEKVRIPRSQQPAARIQQYDSGRHRPCGLLGLHGDRNGPRRGELHDGTSPELPQKSEIRRSPRARSDYRTVRSASPEVRMGLHHPADDYRFDEPAPVLGD